jgi:hypothetical protein
MIHASRIESEESVRNVESLLFDVYIYNMVYTFIYGCVGLTGRHFNGAT